MIETIITKKLKDTQLRHMLYIQPNTISGYVNLYIKDPEFKIIAILGVGELAQLVENLQEVLEFIKTEDKQARNKSNSCGPVAVPNGRRNVNV